MILEKLFQGALRREPTSSLFPTRTEFHCLRTVAADDYSAVLEWIAWRNAENEAGKIAAQIQAIADEPLSHNELLKRVAEVRAELRARMAAALDDVVAKLQQHRPLWEAPTSAPGFPTWPESLLTMASDADFAAAIKRLPKTRTAKEKEAAIFELESKRADLVVEIEKIQKGTVAWFASPYEAGRDSEYRRGLMDGFIVSWQSVQFHFLEAVDFRGRSVVLAPRSIRKTLAAAHRAAAIKIPESVKGRPLSWGHGWGGEVPELGTKPNDSEAEKAYLTNEFENALRDESETAVA